MTAQLLAPTAADAPALSHMAQASFRATFADIAYPPADLAHFLDTAMGAPRYAALIGDPAWALRLAQDVAGAIAGFVSTGPTDLPLPAGEPAMAETHELHQLYLTEAAQGTGLADRLMAWAIDDARARGRVALYLSVYVANRRAQRFYARHGFVEIGRNPFRVGDTIDDDRIWKRRL